MKTTRRLWFQPTDISFVFIGQTLFRAQAQFRSRFRIKLSLTLKIGTRFISLIVPAKEKHGSDVLFPVDNVKFLARVVSNGDHHVRELLRYVISVDLR
ncbi:hypothetical protein NC651_022214 [Populus alba x Populus x berolinensis]|nr:hypothetical protein NC651_022214 [Populus alba x Populus x berolinensis]